MKSENTWLRTDESTLLRFCKEYGYKPEVVRPAVKGYFKWVSDQLMEGHIASVSIPGSIVLKPKGTARSNRRKAEDAVDKDKYAKDKYEGIKKYYEATADYWERLREFRLKRKKAMRQRREAKANE